MTIFFKVAILITIDKHVPVGLFYFSRIKVHCILLNTYVLTNESTLSSMVCGLDYLTAVCHFYPRRFLQHFFI